MYNYFANNLVQVSWELGGAQDKVGGACAPVCPTLATPLLAPQPLGV